MERLGEGRVVRVGGVDLAYRELGDGPPLLMLHGLGDCHRTFRRVAPALAERHRVLLPDLPGHGWSGRPLDAPYDAPWYAETIGGFLDAVGAPRAAICGHSFGGGVALAMLRDHADRIDRLALIAPGGLGREVCAALRVASTPIARSLLGSVAIRRLTVLLAVHLGPARFAEPEDEELAVLDEIARMPGSAEALARTLAATLDLGGQRRSFWDEAETLPRLPPIGIFWGKRDPVVPFAHGPYALERLAHASLHAYERSGHFPHLDEPERFVADLSELLGDPERPCCLLRARGDAKVASLARSIALSAPRAA